MREYFNHWMVLFNTNKIDKFEYFYNFVVSGSIGIIDAWLKNSLKESPVEISVIVGKIILNGFNIIK
ncbi:TetR-like C-terminal domain-containing protein [Romboutsia sp. 1001713B170207_170306_H8]|uniref:TetR-like C-terminal domain-containing protein n=1 Tax=Romboutsia sp. 1001713B170207_170306_H8 TaxID=2787112 RepID=UPI003FA69F7E